MIQFRPVVPARPARYVPPRLTPLGPWVAVTLIQSVPIGPNAWIQSLELNRER